MTAATTPASFEAEVPTASAVAAAVRGGTASAREVVDAALARAEGPGIALGAVIDVDGEAARAAADAIDARHRAGAPLGPLAGVPFTRKDNIAAAGGLTTAGSAILAAYRSPFDATAVARLRAADAVLIGRTNLDEFGMGSSTTTSIYGPARNPWDPKRSPGGSSGGAAVAVAVGAGAIALGTDTGGSVRLPAALCGVVGCKPSYGRISRHGVVAYASSLDQVGVLATDVSGTAVAIAAMSGSCELDATCADLAPLDIAAALHAARPGQALHGWRVGVPRALLAAQLGCDATVVQAVQGALAAASDLGATLVDVTLPQVDAAIAAYYAIATAEASTNLSRYDGLRFGRRSHNAADLRGLVGASRAEGLGPEVQRRVLLGTFALSAGFHDAYFDRACRVRQLVSDGLAAAFADVDVLLLPTSPAPAWPQGEAAGDPVALYAMDVFTVLANLAGLPALSLPWRVEPGALPVGVQLMAPAFEELRLWHAAAALESARGAVSLPSVGAP